MYVEKTWHDKTTDMVRWTGCGEDLTWQKKRHHQVNWVWRKAEGNVCYLWQVKENNMLRYCICAGDYSNTISKADFGLQLNTFLSIARYSNAHNPFPCGVHMIRFLVGCTTHMIHFLVGCTWPLFLVGCTWCTWPLFLVACTTHMTPFLMGCTWRTWSVFLWGALFNLMVRASSPCSMWRCVLWHWASCMEALQSHRAELWCTSAVWVLWWRLAVAEKRLYCGSILLLFGCGIHDEIETYTFISSLRFRRHGILHCVTSQNILFSVSPLFQTLSRCIMSLFYIQSHCFKYHHIVSRHCFTYYHIVSCHSVSHTHCFTHYHIVWVTVSHSHLVSRHNFTLYHIVSRHCFTDYHIVSRHCFTDWYIVSHHCFTCCRIVSHHCFTYYHVTLFHTLLHCFTHYHIVWVTVSHSHIVPHHHFTHYHIVLHHHFTHHHIVLRHHFTHYHIVSCCSVCIMLLCFRHYHMTLLEETVDWIINMNPGMAQSWSSEVTMLTFCSASTESPLKPRMLQHNALISHWCLVIFMLNDSEVTVLTSKLVTLTCDWSNVAFWEIVMKWWWLKIVNESEFIVLESEREWGLGHISICRICNSTQET